MCHREEASNGGLINLAPYNNCVHYDYDQDDRARVNKSRLNLSRPLEDRALRREIYLAVN